LTEHPGIVQRRGTALEAATIRQDAASAKHRRAMQATRREGVRARLLGYLEALLQAELEDREQRLIERRINVSKH
jgi:hypothetical protein